MGKDDAKEGEKIEWLGITLRLLLGVLAAVGILFSVITLSGCDMFEYLPRIPPVGVNDSRPLLFQNISVAEVGLYRYDPNSDGCRDISDDFDNLTWQFKTAQVCAPLAAVLACVATGLLLIEFCCCRYPCSRLLVSIIFLMAFISQCLSMLVYAADVCKPNYPNGPYPCSPLNGTWYSVVAIVIFFICAIMGCCISKPVPMIIRAKEAWQNDKNDGCMALCAKKPVDEEEEEAEENEEELEEPMTPEEVQEQATRAAVTTALTTARRGKLEEIEKQLVLMEKYKDLWSEEEYNAKVALLLGALPDPENYDEFTKIRGLVVLQEKEEQRDLEEGSIDYYEGVEGEPVEDEEGEPGEGEEVEAADAGESEEGTEKGGEADAEKDTEDEEEPKKSRIGAAAAAVGGAAGAVGAAMTKPFHKNEAPEAPKEPPVDASV